jgi:hypothetical protein
MFEGVDWIVIKNGIGRRQKLLCQVPDTAMGGSDGRGRNVKAADFSGAVLLKANARVALAEQDFRPRAVSFGGARLLHSRIWRGTVSLRKKAWQITSSEEAVRRR